MTKGLFHWEEIHAAVITLFYDRHCMQNFNTQICIDFRGIEMHKKTIVNCLRYIRIIVDVT